MKRIKFTLALLILALASNAQDSLFFKSGKSYLVKIVEVSDVKVRFKKWTDQEGASYKADKTKLKSLKYSTGKIIDFNVPLNIDSVSTPHKVSNNVSLRTSREVAKSDISENLNLKSSWSVGVNAYLIAPGISIGRTLIEDKLHIRAGWNSLVYDLPNSIIDKYELPDTIVSAGNLSVGRVYVGIDYQVKGIFNLVGGVQYNDFTNVMVFGLTKNHIVPIKFDVAGTPGDLSDDIEGTVVVTKEDIGSIKIVTEAKKFAPFVGLAFGRAVPEKRIGFRYEFGAIFQGNLTAVAQSKIVDTKFEDVDNPGTTVKVDVSKERVIVDAIKEANDLMKPVTILPYISFGINVKLNMYEKNLDK